MELSARQLITYFEVDSTKYQEINISYKDIYLSQDSFLINSNNQKKIYVTEKEFEIIKLSSLVKS